MNSFTGELVRITELNDGTLSIKLIAEAEAIKALTVNPIYQQVEVTIKTKEEKP